MANHTLSGGPAALAPPPLRPDASGGASSADVISAVEWALADFLAGEVAALVAVDRALGAFARTARDSVLAGGKRVRPTFAYWGWRGLVGPHEPVAPLVPALAALELLHAFALVHDDVMDGSDTRRGRPTVHRRLAAQHTAAGRGGDPDRFGASAAVLVGDLCLIWADRLMAGAGVPAHTLAAARRTYDQMRVEAVAGQYLDVLGESQPNAWTVERALCVARHKTASYTVRRPLEFGAALADGAGDQAGALAAYAEYGLAVGEAFQLRDDLLGVYGDPAVTGKPAGDDLRTGKPTTLLMVARELASPAQRAELDGGLAGAANHLADAASSGAGRGDSGPGDHRHALTDADVARLADLVTRTGAVAQVERMIDERVAAAITAIGAARIDTVARRALTRLAMVAARRQA